MAILGEHVRVPEVLCRKFIKPGSLSRQSRSTPWNDIAAMLSCATEVRRSDLSVREKARLYATVAGFIEQVVRRAGTPFNVSRLWGRRSR